MDQNLRYQPDRAEPEIDTYMDFTSDEGILRAVEKCNGSGDCRKTTTDATICPSYRATKAEKDSTRGRANVLREVLTQTHSGNPFDNEDIKQVMDLCISCKACASECPSSVDMATYKAEFLYQYQRVHAPSLRDRIFAYNGRLSKVMNPIRGLQNATFKTPILGHLIKKNIGDCLGAFLTQTLCPIRQTINQKTKNRIPTAKSIFIWMSSPTIWTSKQDGMPLSYYPVWDIKSMYFPLPKAVGHIFPKVFLKQAKACADLNVEYYKECITAQVPLLGIEPSALYTFKDEYLKLATDKKSAEKLAQNCFLIEEFIAQEIDRGHISTDVFSDQIKTLKIHAHCYQKSIG